MDRDAIITELHRRARSAESAMVRVLSRDELAWLVEPLLRDEPTSAPMGQLAAVRASVDLREPTCPSCGREAVPARSAR